MGGGAAVFEHLTEEWKRTRPFELHVITPAILGVGAPGGGDVVQFGEGADARVCRDVVRGSRAEILRHDPADVVVLANDVSEGPDFARLGARGYRVFTIYHVDVVAYVSAIYGRGWLAPETTVRWYRRMSGFMPDVAGLIWD